jgi:hypothetical protein
MWMPPSPSPAEYWHSEMWQQAVALAKKMAEQAASSPAPQPA